MTQETIIQRFTAVNESLGLGPNDYTAGAVSHIAAETEGAEVILDQTGDSALKGHVIQTKDLDQLQRIVRCDSGPNANDIQVPGSVYDSLDTGFLENLESCTQQHDLNEIDHSELIKLASLYIFGYSKIDPELHRRANDLLSPSGAG